MDTERAQVAMAIPVRDGLPVDAEIITATIRWTVRLAAKRPNRRTLLELQQLLRGHIGLLLPLVRESILGVRPGSIEAHQLTVRLDGIETQTRRELSPGPLLANVQVQQLACDCQWLLACHTVGSA
ncbi:DUF6415 family natural product biosynthesis protein [Streptomyces sp. NPDC048644]|uniref:DUF6415 family natural product biosynthesis protein n=1 Tax=Streptomyces sp. NPDC048644 TaxID=3365582 RepID=UPI0037187622